MHPLLGESEPSAYLPASTPTHTHTHTHTPTKALPGDRHTLAMRISGGPGCEQMHRGLCDVEEMGGGGGQRRKGLGS